ncbi:ABC transporter permease [Anaerolentibacter hominis]|uniref:ABC transporter permease n=1 Tax=Anaerolentibacter hominis TaxID=3079009 RepID=UPI0031B82DDC
MNLTLLKKEWKSNYKLCLIFAGVLALYQAVILYMFDPALGSSLDQFTEAMPELMAMFGMANAGGTLIEFLANYLYGALLLIFPLVFEILLINKLVVRYVDRGSMAYLLSTKNSRRKIIVTQAAVVWIFELVLLGFSTLFMILTSQIAFPGELAVYELLKLNVCLFLLQFSLSGICFLAACASSDSRYYHLFGAGIPVLFYLVQMLANMGGKLENLKYATLFTLFEPMRIIGEGINWVSVIILAVLGILLYGLAIRIFCRKDLSL